MSNPQLEDGYTRIANELFDALLLADLSKREQKIVYAVIRATYGYNKKSDVISTWWLSKMTGIDVANVSRTAAALERRSILHRSVGERRHGQEVLRIGINKKYKEWNLCQNDHCQNDTCANLAEVTYAKLAVEPMPKRQVIKDSKDRKTNIAHSLFEQFYSAYPKKVGRGHAEKAFAKLNPDENLLSLMLSAIDRQKAARAAQERSGIWVPEWKHPSTWINAKCWDDEVQDVKPKPRRVVV